MDSKVQMLVKRFMLSLFFFSATTGVMEVPAALETEASPYSGDSVDDIAIWINHAEPEKSLIIATLKSSNQKPAKPTGLLVYDLHGKQLQFLKGGTPNNVDLREGFRHKGEVFALIAVSHWASNDVTLYRINEDRLMLEPLTAKPIAAGMEEVRGICMHQSKGRFYYFVSSETGLIHQFQILPAGETLEAKRIRRIKLSSRTEGCVVDDDNHHFYASEETRGIWRLDTRPRQGNKRVLIDEASIFGDLSRDIEGLALYKKEDGNGYLIASSQKKGRFVVYDRKTSALLGSFTLSAGEATDAVSYTDGIEVTHRGLGNLFPNGLFIAQDNDNTGTGNSTHTGTDIGNKTETSEKKLNQNFKLVDWSKIQSAIDRMQD